MLQYNYNLEKVITCSVADPDLVAGSGSGKIIPDPGSFESEMNCKTDQI
jgi:hypothetical protein